MTKHLRSLRDINSDELRSVLTLAHEVKKNPEAYRNALAGKSIAMIFSKPSTRTRVSFEVGIHQLGAQAVFLTAGGHAGMQVGRGESHHDTAKVMSRYVDAIVIRTFAQEQIEALAEHGTVPVINALSDAYHPCQAVADLMTLQEHFGDVRGRKLVFVGPGNNVTHSLMLLGPRSGLDIVCACPASLPPDPAVLSQAQADAKAAGTKVIVEHDAMKAVAGAHAIYTDTWVSMGQEDEAEALKAQLADYLVDARLMKAAADDAVFMHCLPAHRGDEVLAEVIDGPQSIIFDEAENRLHAQKALLMSLLEADR